MSDAQPPGAGPVTCDPPGAPPRSFPRAVAPWMALWVAIQGVVWWLGFPAARLERGVEQGAARVEARTVGEVDDDVVREAISAQRQTFRFWRALALVGDFVVGPAGLVVRALAAAVAFAGLAALWGRPIGFDRGLAAAAGAQGYWVLGLAVRAGLMIGLRRAEVETSPTLLLPAGTYPAAVWLALGRLEVFGLIGWLALARGAWSRGQAPLAATLGVALVLWGIEGALNLAAGLVLGAGMRLTLVPDGA